MTGAPKPTPTQLKEKEEFPYRKRSCTNMSLSAYEPILGRHEEKSVS
jgi:hypothetical protein